MDLLAGIDFFTAEVLTLRGLVTYYVLFFTHLPSRQLAKSPAHTQRPYPCRLAPCLHPAS